MVKKKNVIELSGVVFNLGSKKKNIASIKRKLKNKRYKGKFTVKVGKTPKSLNKFVKFTARK